MLINVGLSIFLRTCKYNHSPSHSINTGGKDYPRRPFTINAVVQKPKSDSSEDGMSAPAVPGGPVKLSYSISCNTLPHGALQPTPSRGCGTPAMLQHPEPPACRSAASPPLPLWAAP